MKSRSVVAAIVTFAAISGASGQSAGVPPRFEVVSIKPTPASLSGYYAIRLRTSPGRLDYSAASLKAMIRGALDVQDFQIAGPDWISSTRFDVVAKVPEGVPASKVPEMLRTLLEERFRMTTHHESKESPVYELSVGKDGLKMKETDPDPEALAGWMINKGPGHIEGHGMNMSSITRLLASLLGRSVVDQTGLKGSYNFDLIYSSNDTPRPSPPGTDGPPIAPDPDRVSLPTALSELGFRLREGKGPVDLIVVDHIEKVPTEN